MERRLVYARTLCFIEDGNDVLMLKGAPTKRLYANLYNGIGGHVEAGEDVLSSLRREVREETGLELQDPQLRAVINVDEAGKHGVLLFVFVARVPSRQVQPSGEGEARWVPRERLGELPLVEDLHVLLPRILGPAEQGIWWGYYHYDEQGKLVAIA